MRVWLQAIYLMVGSTKDISSNQLHRIPGVTLKTAWFMSRRIREAMRWGGLAQMGEGGGIAESVRASMAPTMKGAPAGPSTTA